MVLRTDASLEIGTGHVMRCMTLAEALRDLGANCVFVSRELPGHLGDRVESAGFVQKMLPPPAPDSNVRTGPPHHASWAGVTWQQDAMESNALFSSAAADWVVLDHYAFDSQWQEAALPKPSRLMVIDDLADRRHSCDLLLDQNLGRTPRDYELLLDKPSTMLLGPQHALLRPEFSANRPASLRRRSGRLDHVLISMGGVDLPDMTGAILAMLGEIEFVNDLSISVVMGAKAPALKKVREQAAMMTPSVDVLVDVGNIAEVMAAADLAIGAVGGTAWERCCLGLPSLMITIAENQEPAAAALQAAGAGVLLGAAREAHTVNGRAALRGRLAEALRHLKHPKHLEEMSAAAARVSSGLGAQTTAARMLEGGKR